MKLVFDRIKKAMLTVARHESTRRAIGACDGFDRLRDVFRCCLPEEMSPLMDQFFIVLDIGLIEDEGVKHVVLRPENNEGGAPEVYGPFCSAQEAADFAAKLELAEIVELRAP